MSNTKRKVMTILGARPQFIKASAVSPFLRKEGLKEVIVHTGQHYDYEMSEIFFKGLNLPKPKYNLGIGSHLHGKQTGLMLDGLEKVMLEEKPDLVIVYGDTNSTLAGAMAAVKLNIPIAHIEGGLRSYDKSMPEEVNRVLVDHIADMHFVPTKSSIINLEKEGIIKNVWNYGDVMYDVFKKNLSLFESMKEKIIKKYQVNYKEFIFVTVHRAENTNNLQRWNNILKALINISQTGIPIIWPVHPRTKMLFKDKKIERIRTVTPLPYLETQILTKAAKVVITDSGGLQKEAAFHGTPCLILRDRTEWCELTQNRYAFLVDDNYRKICELSFRAKLQNNEKIGKIFGEGKSSSKIVERIKKFFK